MSEPESYTSIVTRLAEESRRIERAKEEEESRIEKEKLDAYRARLAPVTDMLMELLKNRIVKHPHVGSIIPNAVGEPSLSRAEGRRGVFFTVTEESSDDGFRYRLSHCTYGGRDEWVSPSYSQITELIPIIIGKISEAI